jgi:hypothetical protein
LAPSPRLCTRPTRRRAQAQVYNGNIYYMSMRGQSAASYSAQGLGAMYMLNAVAGKVAQSVAPAAAINFTMGAERGWALVECDGARSH